MSDEQLKQSRMWLANELRRARKAAGITQGELAMTIGVTQTTVTRWETGERSMSTDKLEAVCRALGVRVQLLREAEADALRTLRGGADVLGG